VCGGGSGLARETRAASGEGARPLSSLQGYLAHKKLRPPQDPTVGLCLGRYGGPRAGALSYERGNPVGGGGSP